MHRQLARSASGNSRRRFMIIQEGFRDDESLTSWSTFHNEHREGVETSFYRDHLTRKCTLTKLIACLTVFWILGAALLVSVESRHQTTTAIKKSRNAQSQFLQIYWKTNQIIPIETEHWNTTVDYLLQWFENELSGNIEKRTLFSSFLGSWLFVMYFGNAVGGVPVKLSPSSRIVATIAAFPSIFLYYWSIFALARNLRSLPRPVIYCFGGVFMLAVMLKLWLSAFGHALLPLLGNGYGLLSVIFNYRAFRTAEGSIATACTVLILHTLFWTVVFALLEETIIWRQCLYLRVVDRLDAESTLLVTLPHLELNRAEHLIRHYAQRSILHRIAVAFLTENDKHKIEKVITEFQSKSVSREGCYDETWL